MLYTHIQCLDETHYYVCYYKIILKWHKPIGYTVSKPQIPYEVNTYAPMVMVIKSNEKEKNPGRAINCTEGKTIIIFMENDHRRKCPE